MSARDGSKRQDQGNERGSSRQRVAEKGETQVAACEALGHDAGTHDGHKQKARSQEFCGDAGAEVELHCRPMFSISFLSASRSNVESGRLRNRPILRSRRKNASRNALSICWLLPSTAAGSGIPQWAVIGWPGHTGQTSLAALSQTVNTKSSLGASGLANSFQLLLRRPELGR